MNRITANNLPADLTGRALFIDEAHHASADGLSQMLAFWRERGSQLFFFTATPYRGDGRPVKLDDMRTYRRSLAEHMAEGFAPRHLEIDAFKRNDFMAFNLVGFDDLFALDKWLFRCG